MLKHYYASLFSIHIRPGCNMSDKGNYSLGSSVDIIDHVGSLLIFWYLLPTDFWFQVNDYLNSGCVEHITFNRGFSYKFIFGPEIIGSVRFVRYREPPAEEVLHSSSSTIVEKECLESESTIDAEQSTGECIYPPDTLATNLFEHKGVPCQVLIDMAETFKSPVEIWGSHWLLCCLLYTMIF